MAVEPGPVTFQVVVNDVPLSESNVADIASKVKTLLMAELGKIDHRGDLKAKPLPTARGIGGGATAGMTVSRE
jgi:hypothetical protein